MTPPRKRTPRRLQVVDIPEPRWTPEEFLAFVDSLPPACADDEHRRDNAVLTAAEAP